VPHPTASAMWGGELVLRDGQPVGQVMSGAWGEALGAYVGLAYIRHPDSDVVTSAYLREGSYQVNVAGDIRPATLHLRAPYDPQGTRVRLRAGSP
jgi:glycine cleavage system aminomethyltransferase T